MPNDNLDKFEVWQLANRLFDHVVEDVSPLARHPACGRLVSQQIAAADSVCANLEEGYGRGSRKEFVQFLHYSRSSLREVIGRYRRMSHWLNSDTIATLRVTRGKIPPVTSHLHLSPP